MEKLVKLVAQKTGLSEEMARMAVELVLDYLKKELPAPVGQQIDVFLKNEKTIAAAADVVGDLLGKSKKTSSKKG
jgi:hypothetical protein